LSLPAILSLAYYLCFAAYFFLGLFMLLQNPKSVTHRVFFALCFFLSGWSFCFSVSTLTESYADSLLWLRISSGSRSFFFAALLHFTLIMTEKRRLLKKLWVHFLIYLPAFVILFTSSLYSSTAGKMYLLTLTDFGWSYKPANTFWNWAFLCYGSAYTGMSTILLLCFGLGSDDNLKKKQNIMLGSHILIASVLSALADHLISRLSSVNLPQLSPLLIMIPISATYYCIRRYGLLAPMPVQQGNDYDSILSESARMKLYYYFTRAFVLAAIANFGFQFYANREPLYSNIIFSSLIMLFGVLIHIITSLKIKQSIQDTLACILMAALIPVTALKYAATSPTFGWIVPVILILLSVAYSKRHMLIIIASTTLLTNGWVLLKHSDGIIRFTVFDHLVRLFVLSLVICIAFYINQIFLHRLKYSAAQIKLQKFLSHISANFIAANEANINDKIYDMLLLIGQNFDADRTFLMLFGSNKKNRVFEWSSNGDGALGERAFNELVEKYSVRSRLQDHIKLSSIQIRDVFSIEDVPEKRWLIRHNFRSLVVFPLRNKDTVIGFMALATEKEVRTWIEEQQDTLMVLANLISDVWLKVAAEKEIGYRANYDALTGLPNRELFSQRLQADIELARSTQTLVGVAFIDIDSFKAVNDTMGHDGGDLLIKEIGKKLTESVRSCDTVARFGGDEFLVIIPQISDVSLICRAADQIMKEFERPIVIRDQEFLVQASVGISLFPADGETADELIQSADMAMYISKQQGKNRYTISSPEMKKEFITNLELTNNLYHALDRSEFILHYQPQMDCKTGKMSGIEALVRWNHPQRGLISPKVFIPIAERTGLINQLGHWVLYEACRQNMAWQEKGLPPVRVAVNLSLGQFRSPNLADIVSDALHRAGLDPQYLELEVTETAATQEPEIIVKNLNKLKELGVTIAIDDFGTEYSSLSRLKTMPVDRIKIDMQFVHGLSLGNRMDEGIINVILQLGQTLGIKVLAEGVEDITQLDFLVNSSCDEIQGSIFHQPKPADEIEPILAGIRMH